MFHFPPLPSLVSLPRKSHNMKNGLDDGGNSDEDKIKVDTRIILLSFGSSQTFYRHNLANYLSKSIGVISRIYMEFCSLLLFLFKWSCFFGCTRSVIYLSTPSSSSSSSRSTFLPSPPPCHIGYGKGEQGVRLNSYTVGSLLSQNHSWTISHQFRYFSFHH